MYSSFSVIDLKFEVAQKFMVKFERKLIYLLPLISISFEIVKSFLSETSQLTVIRNVLFFAYILYLLVKYFPMAIKFNIYLILLMLYFVILLTVKGAGVSQFNYFSLAFLAKMLLPIGFIFAYSTTHIKDINKNLLLTNILFASSIIVFSVLGTGRNQYGSNSGFSVGYFNFSNIYIGSYLLIALPLIYADAEKKWIKNLLLILGLVTVIILVLSVRRTALVILIIGFLVYAYLYRDQLIKFAAQAVAVVVVIILAFPLYKGILMRQIEARSNIMDRGVGDLEEETRYEETLAVYGERIQSPNILVFLFGDHVFDSKGNYDNGIHKERPIHLDMNIVLHGTGVVGLTLLILYHIVLYRRFLQYRVKGIVENERLMAGAFMSMFWSHIFLLFSGGFFTITFNLISHLYMGSILGVYKRAKQAKEAQQLMEIKNNFELSTFGKPLIYPNSEKSAAII